MRKHRTRIIAVGLIAAFFAVIAIGIVTLHPGMGEPDVIDQNDKADETADGGSDEHETDKTADSGPDERETETRLMDVYSQNFGNVLFIPDGAMEEILKDYPTDVSADKLITHTYSFYYFWRLGIYRNGEIDFNLYSAEPGLHQNNAHCAAECVRRLTDDLVYSVYHAKEDEETGLQFNLYVFFERYEEEEYEGQEAWLRTGRALFAIKKLHYSDFDTIHVGSPIEDVIAIDPLTSMYKPDEPHMVTMQRYDSELEDYVEYEVETKTYLEYQDYHLTADGILCITYTRESADEGFVVKSIGYNSTFEEEAYYSKGTIELRIWEQDLPE